MHASVSDGVGDLTRGFAWLDSLESCLCRLEALRGHGQQQFCAVSQLVTILKAAGVPLDSAHLRSALSEQAIQQGRSAVGRDQASTAHIERFKFWVGLPNNYYSQDDWQARTESERS